jgi:uncharacterized membrane protein YfcA
VTETGRSSPAIVPSPVAANNGRIAALAERTGMSVRTVRIGIGLPVICAVLILGTLVAAPDTERPVIVLASLVALAAGLSSTAIGVYGGVLVPGLLLLGVDARFAAALSLFLQVLVIPLAAGSHYRLGNFSRSVFVPLVIGGVIGAFIGPFFAALLPKDVIARFVAGLIVIVGAIVLGTLHWGGLGSIRKDGDVPAVRVTGIGLTAGFASGISGAGWGPLGVKMLILSRIEPKQAIGSSLFARVFMAAAAVVGYITAQSAFQNVHPDFWLILPLFAASIAPMIPGALIVSRLGRERATIGITLLSISLALPTLVFGH